MQLSYRQILDIKCVLANVNKGYISETLGFNKTMLSREITSRKLIDQIDKLFDTIDPKINIMVARLLSGDENNNYQTGSFNQAGANEQHVNYGVNTDLINEKNKTIERLEGEVEFLRKMLLK